MKAVRPLAASAFAAILSACVSSSDQAAPPPSGVESEILEAVSQVCARTFEENEGFQLEALSKSATNFTGRPEQTAAEKKTSPIPSKASRHSWVVSREDLTYMIELAAPPKARCWVQTLHPAFDAIAQMKTSPEFRFITSCSKVKQGLTLTANAFRHKDYPGHLILAASFRGMNFISTGEITATVSDQEMRENCLELAG